ncbi:TMEM165/GDT1 family protein [Leptolyngbyaceae cyanobacterium UHCC 1019]
MLELELGLPDIAPSKIGIVVEAQAIAPPETFPAKPPISSWKVFTSTFVTIFLAELGDKTQMSTLLMSAEFHKPWVIFAGAGTALVATTLIGVWVGQWLSSRLSPRTLDIAAGILLALISVWLVWDVAQM